MWERQNMGIRIALAGNPNCGKQAVSTFASVTARPFFERMGYGVKRENVVDRDGVSLVNYLMSKQLP